MQRDELHTEAERIAHALVARYGSKIPDDVRTTLSYFVSCKHGLARAAEHVVNLRHLVRESP
jgi:hypothetical protein